MRFDKKYLYRLILPLIVEQVLAVTIGMADTVMVSAAGEAAVSGLSLVDSINILLINIFAALATGGAVVVSQYLGKDDRKQACQSAKQLVLVTGIVSLLLMLIALLFRDQLLHLIFGNVEAEVMRNAQIYWTLTALSYPFIALYNSGAALYRSMGNSKISMVNSAMMNGINIIGNTYLIYVLGWGSAGAGTATLISRVIGAVLILWMLKKNENQVFIDSYLHLGYDKKLIKNILKIGVPNGFENGMFQLGKILVQGLIATFGTYAIAANAVANNISSMFIIPGAAIGLGMITVVGQCIGAKEQEQAKYYTKMLLKWAYISMISLNIFILLISGFLLKFYNLSSETTDIAWQLLACHGVFGMMIWPLSFTLPNALRAAGDARFTMIISVVSMWTFRVGLSYVFAHYLSLGVLGVWLAMVCDWAFRTVLFVYRFLSNRWLKKVVAT